MNQSEEIKSKLDIVEIIREYVPVKAVGANFQALCPFHNEKTPSFVISPDKQIWHCFGCGRGGDVFSFVMEREGLNFMEALRLLAPKAGVTLRYDNPETYSQRNRLLDIMELAAKYYAHVLAQPAGQMARDYLTKRDLAEETISGWQLGYSPDSWDSLYKFLKARPLSGAKFTDEEIFGAGLVVQKAAGGGSGRGYYDRFRDRVMFPISDVNNNVIAFTARVNPAKEKTEKMGKYINSPQTAIYDKSRVLFGLNKAKAAIREADLAIVVEGQMDVIACHQHGFKNVVASSGTALSIDQIKLLKRFTNNIAFMLDSDSAGVMASERGSDMINSRLYKIIEDKDEYGNKKSFIEDDLASNLNIYIIELKFGKDPDECLKSNPKEFENSVSNKKLLMQYFFDTIFNDFNLDDLVNKKNKINLFLSKLGRVNNKIEIDDWLRILSNKTEINESILREELIKKNQKYFKEKKKASFDGVLPKNIYHNESETRAEKLAELLLALLIRFPELTGYATSNLDPEELAAERDIQFYKDFIIYYNKTNSFDYGDFRLYLLENAGGEEQFLDKLILLGEKDFYDYTPASAKTEMAGIITELKRFARQRKVHKLQREIAQAEKAGDQTELSRLMEELKNLTVS